MVLREEKQPNSSSLRARGKGVHLHAAAQQEEKEKKSGCARAFARAPRFLPEVGVLSYAGRGFNQDVCDVLALGFSTTRERLA